jgi:hypothetical protein
MFPWYKLNKVFLFSIFEFTVNLTFLAKLGLFIFFKDLILRTSWKHTKKNLAV